MIIEIILWLSVFCVFWVYIGYLVVLKLLTLCFTRKTLKAPFFPEISLIVTAYNEEKRIEEKINNCISLNYPKDKLEIIIVSDGSNDKTVDIIKSFNGKNIKLLALPSRNGKHYSQGKGVHISNGDILVFSDATTLLDHNALNIIARNFSDLKIGCVSGLDKIISNKAEVPGESIYVKYEMILRSYESQLNSLVGVSGSFFAVRKELCEEWISDMSNDFYLPIVAHMKGYRTVLENEAIGYYEVLDEPGKEFSRKVRTIVHGMQVLAKFREILNIKKYGFYSIQMLSHKLLRWMVPFNLIAMFILNLYLYNEKAIYHILLYAQCLLYAMAFVTALINRLKKYKVFRIPFFFVMVNCSILVAWYYFLMGEGFIIWEPTKR